MRRFLAFVMCVSGFTLAVSWTRADEPAAATTGETPLPADSTASARPEIVRTEPGAYRNQNEERSPGDESSGGVHDADSEDLARQLRTLNEEAERLAEKYAGRGLEAARSYLQSKIARTERQLNEAIAADAPSATQSDRVARAEAEIARMQQRMAEILAARTGQVQDIEQILNNLRERAEQLEDSATAEAETARRTIEAQIDNVERFLAERRERREAADPAPERDAERKERRRERGESEAPDGDAPERELRERVRHINAAIEHLNAAGMHDIARNLQQHAQEIAVAHERAQQERRRAAAVQASASTVRDNTDESSQPRELAEQIGELRRELRRLRQEVTELREQRATPPEESKDN